MFVLSVSMVEPVDPVVGANPFSNLTATTAVYRLPVVEDRNGPIRFVYFKMMEKKISCQFCLHSYVAVVVYNGTRENGSSSFLKPNQLSAVRNDTEWYIAAYFDYLSYTGGQQYTIGDGTVTADPSGMQYPNEPLQPDSTYFIYVLVVGYNEENVRRCLIVLLQEHH